MDGKTGKVHVTGNPFQCFFMIEDHMGLIVFIIPGLKRDSRMVDFGHAIECSSWLHQVAKPRKFRKGMVEMFGHFTAGYIVVSGF